MDVGSSPCRLYIFYSVQIPLVATLTTRNRYAKRRRQTLYDFHEKVNVKHTRRLSNPLIGVGFHSFNANVDI